MLPGVWRVETPGSGYDGAMSENQNEPGPGQRPSDAERDLAEHERPDVGLIADEDLPEDLQPTDDNPLGRVLQVLDVDITHADHGLSPAGLDHAGGAGAADGGQQQGGFGATAQPQQPAAPAGQSPFGLASRDHQRIGSREFTEPNKKPPPVSRRGWSACAWT